jgi:biotin transport system permease protein
LIGSLYSERRSWLHAVPAGVKLFALTLLVSLLFWTATVAALAGITLACVLCLASLGRTAWDARRPVLAALVAGGLIAGFHFWLGQPAIGLTSALRLLGACCLGASLTLTTRFQDLLAVFEWLFRPLKSLGVDTERLLLMFALMMRFTEHFFVQWQRLDDAHRLRCGKPGGIRILGPLCIQMLTASQRVADALEVRLGRRGD